MWFHTRLHPLLKKVQCKENAKPDVTSAGHALPSACHFGTSGDSAADRHTCHPWGGRGAGDPGQALLPTVSSAPGSQVGPPGSHSPSCGVRVTVSIHFAAGGCVRHACNYFCIKNSWKCHKFPAEVAGAFDPNRWKKTMRPSLLKECGIKTKKSVFS